jgi:FG-GAP-like repeat
MSRLGLAVSVGLALAVSVASDTRRVAAQQGCTYVLRPASVVLPARQHYGRIDVLTQPGCPWRPSLVSFGFHVANAELTQTGTGVVAYSLDNVVWTEYAVPHTLTLQVEGATFTAYVRPKLNGATYDDGGPQFDAVTPNPDLLWQRQGDGRAAVWLMDRHVLYDGVALPGEPGPDWLIAGGIQPPGDADRIVWQHRLTGQLAEWQVTGLRYLLTPGLNDPDWRVRSMSDLDHDARADLILQHSVSGALAARRLGNNIGFTIDPLWPAAEPDLQWVIAGSSDFNNDGWSDLVWQHQGDGRLKVWIMYGLTRIEEHPLGPGQVADTHWKIGAVVDLDSDNHPDLVWQHETEGWLGVWYMDGLTVRDGRLLSPNRIADLTWKLVGPR